MVGRQKEFRGKPGACDAQAVHFRRLEARTSHIDRHVWAGNGAHPFIEDGLRRPTIPWGLSELQQIHPWPRQVLERVAYRARRLLTDGLGDQPEIPVRFGSGLVKNPRSRLGEWHRPRRRDEPRWQMARIEP